MASDEWIAATATTMPDWLPATRRWDAPRRHAGTVARDPGGQAELFQRRLDRDHALPRRGRPRAPARGADRRRPAALA